jgi:xanthine dehydrogenase iron-sulfur cluster and FAD-binding subunit A
MHAALGGVAALIDRIVGLNYYVEATLAGADWDYTSAVTAGSMIGNDVVPVQKHKEIADSTSARFNFCIQHVQRA